MKCCSFLFAALFLLTISFSVSAQDNSNQPTAVQKQRGKFAQMDKNGDGMISRDEWTRKPKAFDRLDLNHDGFLSREELMQARGKHKGKGKGITQMDANGDGKIARDEWTGKAKAFARFDTNRDGYISQEEINISAQQ